MLDKIIVGNLARFFESVPSTFDFGIDISIDNFVLKVVVAYDLNGDEVILETEILGIQ